MSRNTEEIRAIVNEIIAEELESTPDKKKIIPQNLTEQTLIGRDLGADSLDVINIALQIEDKFDIKIPDEAMGQDKTIGMIVDELASLLEKK